MKKITLIIFFFATYISFSQDIFMTNGTFNQCSGNFYDSGGPTSNYGSNQDFVVTICPASAGQLTQLDFTTFNTQLGDILTIFNGDSTASPSFGPFEGGPGNSPGFVSATEDNPTGCLTIQFVSDGGGSTVGWAATISCFTPCQVINAQLDTASPAPNADGYIRVCPDEPITLTGSGVFSTSGVGATYEWDLGDGNTVAGQTATFSYSEPGVYLVNLNITDTNVSSAYPNGCSNDNLINQVIQVGTEPDFTNTRAAQPTICFGESVEIIGSVTPVEFLNDCTPPASDVTVLPDQSGATYNTPITVDCYDSGQVITDVNQIVEICINMEHSYSGDLDIFIISPNGQQVQLFDQAGTGTYFGGANNLDNQVAGIGAEYCFSMNASVPLGNAPTVIAGSNPPGPSWAPGTYLPVQSFNGLVGSPLNGNWTIRIVDNIGIDDGTIFGWVINFDPNLQPPEYSFTPAITSESWDADPTITGTNGNNITVTPPTAGTYCYTYRVTDDFGCEYTEEVCIIMEEELFADVEPVITPLCQGEDAEFLVTGPANSEVSYTINGGAVQIITLDGSGNGTVSITSPPIDQTIVLTQIQNINPPTVGNAIEATGAFNSPNAIGAILPTGTTANNTNSAKLDNAYIGATLTLGDVVPAGTVITISAAKSSANGSMTVTNGTNNLTINTGALNTIGYFNFTTTVATNTLTFSRVAGSMWIDGVTYTLINTGCILPLNDTETIFIGQVYDTAFSLTPDCNSAIATINGDTGGVFSFSDPQPTDGAVINSTTGEITNGIGGTSYSVLYSFPGNCSAGTTQNITLLPSDDATFSLTPNCDGATAVVTGLGGGSFSLIVTDGAASIDPVSGNITGASQGVIYTVQYITNGSCPFSTTQDFTKVPTDDGSFTLTPTCDGATVNITGTQGGTFTFNPSPVDGATIDPVLGTITGGTSGESYSIEYATSGQCPVIATQTVTVLTTDDSSFTLTPTCDGAVASVTGVPNGTFVLNPMPSDGATINTSTGTITNGVSQANYTVEYTSPGTCPSTSSQTVTVLTSDDSSFMMIATCDGGTANITGLNGGTFTFNPVPSDGAVINSVSGTVTGGTPSASYTIEYTTNDICPTTSIQILNVLPEDDSTFSLSPTCDGALANITGLSGGSFVFNPVPSDGAQINATTGTITGAGSSTSYTVDYTTNGDCPTTTSVTFSVLPKPTIFAPTDLRVCDDNVGDGLTSIDLDLRDDDVTGGNAQYTVTYHLSQSDADSGASPLSVPYTNISNPQTVYVRVESTVTGCYDTTELVLHVDQAPVASDPLPLEYCDADSDGFGVFTLTDADSQITGGVAGLTVTYHETAAEAQNGVNAQASPYSNIVGYAQTLYVRVESAAITTGCASFVQLQLVVKDTPQIADPSPLQVCDDNTDGFARFDLTTRDSEILGALDAAQYSVSYYEQQADADVPTGAIAAPGAYTNTVPFGQTLWVRVDDTANGCYKLTTLELVVNALPVVVQPTPLTLCDDGTADQMTVFDLTVKDDEITGGDGSLNVSYHTTQAGALAGTGAITPATSYTNMSVGGNAANPQTLYVRVEDGQTGCADFTTLTIRVLPNPTPGPEPADLILCDDTNTGDATELFDLTANQPYIINGEGGVTATYHTTLGDAMGGTGAIADPVAYGNTATPQTIYVRVTNDATGCYAIVDFDIAVNPLPEVVAVEDYIICEVNTDGFAQFDLSTRDSEVLNGQDPALYSVTYHATQLGADNLTGSLVGPYTNTGNPQQIFVAITNRDTGCSISTASFNIEVDNGAQANSDADPITQAVCDNIGDNDGLGQFDLALNDPEVLDGQDLADFTVTYYATLADAQDGVQPIPYTYENISNPQVIYARVDNDEPDAAGMDSSICYDVAELTLRVDLLPIFDLGESYTLCVGTNGTEVIGVPVLDTGLSAADYTFEWSLGGNVLPGETGPSLTASQDGTYGVLVTNTATGCTNGDSTEVVESSPPTVQVELATEAFSEDHVIVATAVGTGGTYEYSLDGGPWQESGIFAGVSYGLHTVTARDRNGCGLAQGTVTVLDYPHFFTPNGDGRHETWNIVGFADQASAKIYIFDRFGKLLKQISPSGTGWDGTYVGREMPTSDYWFTVEYTEPATGQQKQFSAHFTLKR